MRIFGLYITTGAARDREKRDELQAHADECNQHMERYGAFQRRIEELDMVKDWWRMRFEQLEARTGRITIRRRGSELEIQAGDQRVMVYRWDFGLKVEVDR